MTIATDSFMRFGSASKTFTTTAVLQLVDQSAAMRSGLSDGCRHIKSPSAV
jgi:Beta-lactamase